MYSGRADEQVLEANFLKDLSHINLTRSSKDKELNAQGKKLMNFPSL